MNRGRRLLGHRFNPQHWKGWYMRQIAEQPERLAPVTPGIATYSLTLSGGHFVLSRGTLCPFPGKQHLPLKCKSDLILALLRKNPSAVCHQQFVTTLPSPRGGPADVAAGSSSACCPPTPPPQTQPACSRPRAFALAVPLGPPGSLAHLFTSGLLPRGHLP